MEKQSVTQYQAMEKATDIAALPYAAGMAIARDALVTRTVIDAQRTLGQHTVHVAARRPCAAA